MKYGYILFILIGFTSLPSTFGQSNHASGFIKNQGQIEDQNGKLNSQVLYQLATPGANISLIQGGFQYHLYKSVPIEKENSYVPPVNNMDHPAAPELQFHRIDVRFLNANPHAIYTPIQPYTYYLNYYTQNTPEAGVRAMLYQSVLLKDIYSNIDILFTQNNGFKYDIIIHPGGNISDIQMQFNGADFLQLNNAGALTIHNSIQTVTESIPLSFLSNEDHSVKSNIEVNYKLLNDGKTVAFYTTEYNTSLELTIDPWASYFGGNDTDYGQKTKVDKDGNVYLGGLTASIANIATTGSHQSSRGGDWDAFIAKFNKSGSLLWATYYGGAALDYNYSLDIDSLGKRVGICGHTQSSSGIATSGAFQTTLIGSGTWDAFVAVFDDSGSRKYGTYLGASSHDYGQAISFDGAGNVYASGITYSTTGMATSGVHQTSLLGSSDIFLTKFNSSYTRQWSTYYGGASLEYLNQIICDANGDILLAASSNSTSNISTSGVHQPSNGGSGNMDAVLAKFNTKGQLLWGTYYGGSSTETGLGIALDKKSNIFLCGTTNSTTGINSSGGFQTSLNGSKSDAFLVKFNKNGTRQWGTYFGGSEYEEFYGVSCDSSNNVYAAGYTQSSSGITTAGAHQTSFAGGEDGIMVKFTDSGKRVWCTYYGGSDAERIYGMGSNANGTISISGYTLSNSGIATSGTHQTVKGVGIDGFLAVFNTKGGLNSIENNQISGETEVCYNTSPGKLTGSTPTGGNSSYTYSWLSSTTSATTGFSAASGTNNQKDYTPGNITQNIWYKRAVNSGTLYDTSTTFKVSIQTISANFSVNDTSQCQRLNKYIFTNKSTVNIGKISKYFWWFNSDTSTTISPEKQFSNAGTITVKIVVVSSGNCKDSIQKTVVSFPHPKATFSVNNYTQCANKNNFSFSHSSSISSGTISSVQWDFGDGSTNTTPNPSKVFASSGSYNVTFIAISDQGCSDTAKQQVFVKTNPIADFSINTEAQCLAQNKFAFTDASKANGETINLYTWYTGDGNQTNSQNPVYSYTQAGSYKVQLSVRNQHGCTDSTVKSITVHPAPDVKPSVNFKNQCLKNNVFDLVDSSKVQGGGIFKRIWYFDDGTKSGFLKLSKSYTTLGNKNITLVVETNRGCIDSAQMLLRVNADAQVKLGLTTLNACLGGNNFQLSDNSTIAAGSISKRRWDFGDGNSSTQKNISKSYTSAGTFTIKLWVGSDQGCNDSTEDEITVLPGPVIGNMNGLFQNLLAGTSYTYLVSSQPNTTYTWKVLNGTILSGQNTSSVNLSWNSLGAGSIIVTASQSGGCKDSVQKIVEITGYSHVKNIDDAAIKIWPNPASDKLFIQSTTTVHIRIYTNTGTLIYDQNPDKYIPLNNFTPGIYELIATNDAGLYKKIKIAVK